MKIEIDLGDCGFDEYDISITEALKVTIIDSVKRSVLETFKPKIDKEIKDVVSTQVDKEYKKVIESTVKDSVKTLTFKPNYSNDPIVIDEYIKQQFNGSHINNSMNDVVRKMATSIADELKERYDLLFASQIVSKMAEQGLLKEGMKEMLLEDKKKE